MADSQIEKKWNHNQKKLLLTTRLRNEPDFCAKRKKRTVLWEKVLREIKEVDDTFPFSRDDITRKFLNFCVTYKRIKRHNNTSGEAATTWEFFEEMDEVYGSRSDIAVPASTLESSLYDILSDTQVDPPEMVMSTEPATKKKKCEVLEFLKQQACNDKESIQNLIPRNRR
ncbi:uncharacterized protein LOC135963089 [Calliphora vicina]|uniref:uncharacterized protein LOC135963089 n=1 Tax=Calliphora vicina TaxID=7373 RepID=UPI00325B47BB